MVRAGVLNSIRLALKAKLSVLLQRGGGGRSETPCGLAAPPPPPGGALGPVLPVVADLTVDDFLAVCMFWVILGTVGVCNRGGLNEQYKNQWAGRKATYDKVLVLPISRGHLRQRHQL